MINKGAHKLYTKFLDNQNINSYTKYHTDIKFNLDQFTGQKIKISIEQTDHGTGIGEIAFIDCIVVEEV